MRWCWDVLTLSLLIVHVWSGFVPITLHQQGSRLHARNAPDPAELLQPTNDAELLYAHDELEGPPTLVTLSVKHETHPYVVLERFEELLSSITCTTEPGNGSTTISMTFVDRQHLMLAEQQWSGKAGLTFITHHHSCNEDVEQREVYRASYVRFDHNSTTATITGERKEFGYSDANTAFRLQGTTAPKHMIRRIRRRDLNPQKPPTESTFSISYYRRWRDEDLLFTIPGQVEVHCIKCSSDGELRVGFDFDIQSLDVGRIGSAITDVLHGLKPKPFYNRAIMTFELVKPYRMEANMRTTVHAGLSVRWPGLVSPLSGKKVLGDKMMKEGEKKFITIGAFQFFTWYGFGFMFIGAAGGSGEIDLTSHSYMPNGLLAKMDFLNPSNNYFNPQLKRDVKTRVNKLDSYLSMDLAYGLNADITVKVKIPKGDWSSLRKGGGRGKIGYKDDVLKWYAGGYIDLIGAGVEIASPSGLDANCEPSDKTKAVRISAEMGAGLAPYVQWVIEKRNNLIPRIDAFPYSSSPRWYKKWPLGQYCQVIGGLATKPPPIIPDPKDLQISEAKKEDPWWWFPQRTKHGGTAIRDPTKVDEKEGRSPQPPLFPQQQPPSIPPGQSQQQQPVNPPSPSKPKKPLLPHEAPLSDYDNNGVTTPPPPSQPKPEPQPPLAHEAPLPDDY